MLQWEAEPGEIVVLVLVPDEAAVVGMMIVAAQEEADKEWVGPQAADVAEAEGQAAKDLHLWIVMK
ncbi:hypothetical protein D3C78_1640760 [compost metagenome]